MSHEMKYKLHIPYVNRQDMLKDAISSVRDPFENIHVWANGVTPPDVDAVVHVLSPLSFTGVMNEMIRSSWDDDVMLWMHTDAVALNGSAQKFMDQVQKWNLSNERWGALFTSYDAFCSYNMRAVRSVGFYDPQFYAYVSDNDYYRRFVNAGWPLIDTHLYATDETMCGVLHRDGYSSTVKADPLRKKAVDFRARSSFDVEYYKFKWGGWYEQETYFYPFGQDLSPQEHALQEYSRLQYDPVCVEDDRERLIEAIGRLAPCIIAADPDRGLFADYHVVEPYAYQRDDRKTIVAIRKRDN